MITVACVRNGTAYPVHYVERLRNMGRDLVLSVQPKTTPQQRQGFLASLPVLMRTLNEGLDLIRWPEPERKRDLLRLWLTVRRPLALPADFTHGGITSRTAAFG